MLRTDAKCAGSWLVRPKAQMSAKVRLFCIPFAGVGPSAFRGWSDLLEPGVEVVCIHTPGRESRIRERPIETVVGLAQSIADAIPGWLDRPFAIFGHSLGGLIGFELARTLRSRGLPQPLHLFASATRAPSLPNPYPALRDLPDRELLDQVNRRYDGSVPEVILSSQELCELFVPALRADLAALETYEYLRMGPLTCPISVFGGDRDTHITADVLKPWALETERACDLRMFDGGHLFLQSARDGLVGAIRATLSPPTSVWPGHDFVHSATGDSA